MELTAHTNSCDCAWQVQLDWTDGKDNGVPDGSGRLIGGGSSSWNSSTTAKTMSSTIATPGQDFQGDIPAILA